ncbi:hypothetical protein EDB81DRAFT_756080 [Dactylonectria macrodidyma]|uniref:CCR4-NOT transcription complex subunit 4 n=1 Tax=Dactylonectria macrodidyma TaxID=307937 RepID=A0A9P9JHD3_9HYPO|nr:hypothetical protein EDB81DRAFT_756080 [Dactylonectria macrodidyma]
MAPQDSFIDEEEDTCPLCIEEFDLSDRNFRPCPCGYQVCQFCFNNIKNNMNGLCPACRRPYDEKTIQWKVVTTEEVAEFRLNIQKNQKKRAQEQRQKEVQKREAEKENRKNLIGVRVVQKNLVYITGLAPTVREDELLKTLRKPEFFGQYGNIQKISISNRKSSDGQHQSLGIYVTFERPEEATRCIQAVHGSQNGDRMLKAQHGTTKYCSAWLKNEKCSNPGCMFLHEQGDEEDSYSRQDLSSMNSIHTQRPLPGGGSRSVSRQQAPQPTPPPVASHPMARSLSKEGSESGADGSALPSSANWARNPQRSRRGSHATSGAASSPAISTSLPVTAEPVPEEAVEDEEEPESEASLPQQTEPVPSPSEAPKGIPESSLKALLRALQACTLPTLVSAEVEDLNPPMFDIRGGEKRKAMREEEDSRLTGEQEEQVDVCEPSEGEPETGGSLALGGEPEDRDATNDGNFDQRRPSAQPPIQRNNADGIFGPALTGSNFNQNPGNSVSRSMTPQQLFLRSQSGFGDQVPPGISNPSGNFQSQGHNRQSSRFSFANDNQSSTTNVKLAANPRIMAQQSSMMPNSFQSQGNNQFYGTSMPGPPPGLKSTGTPPSMFGQGFGGAGFGGAPKDNSNELLQSLIGRSRGGNNQAHDAGKREYMISSFSNQYPPSSTSSPAPASGLLALLYGNQPGAFQDMGSKQKKKGKKHRHANTSSSGGSGLVDLADPSILQARMQHQSQGNAGVGQGLFGGQSQGVSFVLLGIETIYGLFPIFFTGVDNRPHIGVQARQAIIVFHNPSMSSDDELSSLDELPSLDEASSSVDALVSDEPLLPAADVEDRRSVPPGLAIPLGLANISRPPSTQGHRFGHVIPALPKVPPPGLSHGALTPDQSPRKPATPDSEARRNIRTLASETGISRQISQSFSRQQKGSALQDEDFPALGSRPATPTPKATPKAKKQAEKIVDRFLAKPTQEPKSAEKKKPIALNTQIGKAVTRPGETSASTEKSITETSAAFPPLPTPGTALSSPITRSAPKTLRVLPTPKTESAPPASPALTLASVALSAASRAVSTSYYRPETPGSEMVSDSASVVSTSVTHSRASSPPPSRVGAAAIRTTTKSQQRKQRKDALKQDTKLIAEVALAEGEVHAPVLGRKKKQKKEKPAKAVTPANSTTTPAPEATAVEAPAPKLIEKEKSKEKEAEEKPALSRTAQKKAAKGKGKEKAKENEKEKEKETDEDKEMALSTSPTGLAPKATESDEPDEQTEQAEKLQLGPSSVFADLRKSLWTPAIDKLQIIKLVSSGSSRADNNSGGHHAKQAGHCKECSCKCGEIQDEDLAALRAGKPVRKQFHVDGSRMLITPNGDCVRGLTAEEEDAFLELQAAIATTAENPGAFIAPRHQPGSGAFSLIKGRAVPNGRPNIFPSTAQLQSQDPIGKLQREDALSYINQYVLPRLNLGATNMGFPKGTSPTKDAAAASLNSLAPYFYGPDAAAGVGIYSPPDGARNMADFGTAGMQPDERGKTIGMGGMPLMSVEDAEGALAAARRETDKLEKGLNQVIRRNRRILLGGGN